MTRSLFWQLMRKDLREFRRVYPGKFFDTCFLLFTNAIVFGYFMPKLGVSADYGPFIVVGAIASFGLFDIIAHVGELIFDIEGDRTITFKLAMPVPSWVVFAQLAIKWGLNSFLLCAPLFFVGKLLLWDSFDLTSINLFKLLIIFPTASLFFGTFSLWLAGVLKKVINLSRLFLRFINPLFMFGGYFFTWKDSFELAPAIGYAILIDPMIYVMEGMRAACLGQAGYLPFWNCVIVLWGFILILGTHAITSLKKRLDCI
ncbi:MAG: ABC transporter permease [Simkaniaceae bacterium]|nr:ABC transporter permease [Candidatus Sacchlamyda saccharinae]